ncbi:MAG: MopE-related protein [Deltaproteobacteria bacterium]|nr:MopE-related protein [Deltaproteobacteria bacterium]
MAYDFKNDVRPKPFSNGLLRSYQTGAESHPNQNHDVLQTAASGYQHKTPALWERILLSQPGLVLGFALFAVLTGCTSDTSPGSPASPSPTTTPTPQPVDAGVSEEPCTPSQEFCDGQDNDCDGETDEDYAERTQTCGKGACANTQPVCANGKAQPCYAFDENSSPEICDAIDNDCDGYTDEQFDLGTKMVGEGECRRRVDNCRDGQTNNPDPLQGAISESCDRLDNDCDGATDEELGETSCGLGECEHSISNCLHGALQYCDPLQHRQEERCDGLDNDCDGSTDEELYRPYYSGRPGTMGIGACHSGMAVCINGLMDNNFLVENTARPEVCNGADDDCNGRVDDVNIPEICNSLDDDCDGDTDENIRNCLRGEICNPQPEICNGRDDDCDDFVDENLTENFYPESDFPLTAGIGPCLAGLRMCIGERWMPVSSPITPHAEMCDGIDNDCNGEVDNDLGIFPCGLGDCRHMIAVCENSTLQFCTPDEAVLGAAEETCDNSDNDCDGTIDENIFREGRYPGPEESRDVGLCRPALESCIFEEWREVSSPIVPALESCDLQDNDCDGLADETADLGTTTCGLGPCENTVDNCIGGALQVCAPLDVAFPEACDTLDNDCDGASDETADLGTTTCGLGACEHTADNCFKGALQLCNPMEGASLEACNSIDDDCDAGTDEVEDLGRSTCGVTPCENTVDNCVNGVINACDPFLGSSGETCDNIDNDCDSETDETADLGQTSCGFGACQNTEDNCVDNQPHGCTPLNNSSLEICADGVDNNCNGQTDELSVAPSPTHPLAAGPYPATRIYFSWSPLVAVNPPSYELCWTTGGIAAIDTTNECPNRTVVSGKSFHVLENVTPNATHIWKVRALCKASGVETAPYSVPRAFSVDDSLIAWYKFNANGNGIETDYSGHLYNGNWVGTNLATPPRLGNGSFCNSMAMGHVLTGALCLDGGDDYLAVPARTDFNLTYEVSAMAYLHPNVATTGGSLGRHIVLAKGGQLATNNDSSDYSMAIDPRSNQNFKMVFGTRGEECSVTNNSVGSGAPHFIAGSYDNQTISCYLDGAAGNPFSFIFSTDIPNNTPSVRIGADTSAASTSTYFKGALDDVILRNVVSTEAAMELNFCAIKGLTLQQGETMPTLCQ